MKIFVNKWFQQRISVCQSTHNMLHPYMLIQSAINSFVWKFLVSSKGPRKTRFRNYENNHLECSLERAYQRNEPAGLLIQPRWLSKSFSWVISVWSLNAMSLSVAPSNSNVKVKPTWNLLHQCGKSWWAPKGPGTPGFCRVIKSVPYRITNDFKKPKDPKFKFN